MNIEELRKIDKYSAFYNYISVKQAKEEGTIPESYYEVVPDTCQCGSDNIITKDLKILQCCDPRCKIKMGYALAELFSRFSCKDIGPGISKDLIDGIYPKMKIPSHVEVLRLSPKDFPPSFDGERGITFLWALDTIYKTKITFPELIGKIAIPEYDKESSTIFRGIASTNQLLDEIIKMDGISQFLSSRGVDAPMKKFYLDVFLPDIAYAEEALFDAMRMPGLSNIDVVITGNISPNGESMTKAEFIEQCNEICTLPNGVRPIEVRMTSAFASVPYIIADYPSNTNKYNKGRERGVLISSTDFMNKLKEVIRDVRTKQGFE